MLLTFWSLNYRIFRKTDNPFSIRGRQYCMLTIRAFRIPKILTIFVSEKHQKPYAEF